MSYRLRERIYFDSVNPHRTYLNLNLLVQVRVQAMPAPNLSVQVQVLQKSPEPAPNRTVVSLTAPTMMFLNRCLFVA
jgi:hypothetical protein